MEVNGWKVVTFKGNAIPTLLGHTVNLNGKNELLIIGGTSSKTPLEEGTSFSNQSFALNILTRTTSAVKCVGLKSLTLGFHTTEVVDSKIYIFGGKMDNSISNEMIIFNPESQSISRPRTIGKPPSGRFGHSLVKTISNQLVIFGGTTSSSALSNELFIFDCKNNTWENLSNIPHAPSPRSFHSSTIIGNKIFIFGGNTEDGLSDNSIYSFDLSKRVWTKIIIKGTSPEPRFAHSSIAINNTLIIHGGVSQRGSLDDLFLFDTKRGVWSQPENIQLLNPSAFHTSIIHSGQVYCLSENQILAIPIEILQKAIKNMEMNIPVEEREEDKIEVSHSQLLEIQKRIDESISLLNNEKDGKSQAILQLESNVIEVQHLLLDLLSSSKKVGNSTSAPSLSNNNNNNSQTPGAPNNNNLTPSQSPSHSPSPSPSPSPSGSSKPLIKRVISQSFSAPKSVPTTSAVHQSLPPITSPLSPISTPSPSISPNHSPRSNTDSSSQSPLQSPRQSPQDSADDPQLKSSKPLEVMKAKEIKPMEDGDYSLSPPAPLPSPSTDTPKGDSSLPVDTSSSPSVNNLPLSPDPNNINNTTPSLDNNNNNVTVNNIENSEKKEGEISPRGVDPTLPSSSSSSTPSANPPPSTPSLNQPNAVNPTPLNTNPSMGKPQGGKGLSNSTGSAPNQRPPISKSNLGPSSTSSLNIPSPTLPFTAANRPPRAPDRPLPSIPTSSDPSPKPSPKPSSKPSSKPVNNNNNNNNRDKSNTLANSGGGGPSRANTPSRASQTRETVFQKVLNMENMLDSSSNKSGVQQTIRTLMQRTAEDQQQSRLSFTHDSSDRPSVKGGYVYKRKLKKKAISQWKLRYMQIQNNSLFYYTSQSDTKALGEIRLISTKVRKIGATDNKPFCMEMTTSNAVYHIATDKENDLLEWIEVIDKIKENIFTKGEDELVNDNVNNNGNSALSSSSTSLDDKEKKKINILQKKFATLNRVSKREENIQISVISPSPLSSSTSTANNNENEAVATTAPKPEISPAERMKSKKESVIHEIISTERDYVNDLEIITEQYLKSLEARKLIRNDQRDAIFGNIDELTPIHSHLLSELEREFDEEDPNFGSVFVDFAPKFSVYSRYCSTQSSSSQALAQYCEENAALGVCLEELRMTPEVKQLDLPSFLIKPLQRLCKYPLLLRELKSSMEENDANYPSTINALDVISQVVNGVNENKRMLDSYFEILRIQESIADKDLNLQMKGRHLLREGDFKKVVFENVVVRSTIWLFNDLILVAKRKDKNKFHFRAMFPLEHCIVWDLDPSGNAPPEKKNGFSILRNDKKTDKLLVFATSPKEKIEWIDLINGCVANCSTFIK